MTTIPTISTLKSNLISDFNAEFDISVNPYGKAFLEALATVLAGMLWICYTAIGFVQGNLWVDTCDYETLIRFGYIILARYPNEAIAGQYTCTVTGTTGAVIPNATVWAADSTSTSPGQLFTILGGAYTMPGTTGTITIQALSGGLSSRLSVGDTLTSQAPILNVSNNLTVTVEVLAPINAETEAQYRQAVINKIQLTPGSWSAVDYRLVGAGVAGVYNTYAYATSGASNEASVFLQGPIPLAYPGPSVSGTVLTNYETALELVRPMTVFLVNYYSSPINNIDVTIVMGGFPAFTTAQKALISSALTSFVNSVHPFILACDNISDRNDTIATYNLSSTISAAVPGYGFSAVTFTVAGTPATLWLADLGNIPYLNSITYA